MLNWLLRYQPVIRMLEQFPPDVTVLDVGAGWHGLSLYWSGHVVQTDLRFAATAGGEQRAGWAEFVVASAERLPFEDGAFDVAVSVDMLEHLPEELRRPSLAELFRVARRGVIVACPMGEPARRIDQRLARLYRRRGADLPDWLREHLEQERYPTRELVEAAVPSGWEVSLRLREHNSAIQYAVIWAESTRPFTRLTRVVERWGRRHRLLQPLPVGATVRWYYLCRPLNGGRSGTVPTSGR
jgi:SAM-dependent methyltransferase